MSSLFHCDEINIKLNHSTPHQIKTTKTRVVAVIKHFGLKQRDASCAVYQIELQLPVYIWEIQMAYIVQLTVHSCMVPGLLYCNY